MRVLPSQIVKSISNIFGQIYETDRLGHEKQKEVRCLLALLDQVPPTLISLPFYHYLEYEQCKAALASMLPGWALGDTRPAFSVNGKNPVERIRRLMTDCADEEPAPEPEFPFIDDDDVRHGVEERVRAAWIDFGANEWIGSTISGGVALEATLLWVLKRSANANVEKLDKMHLGDLITEAEKRNLIDSETAKQATLAQEARNLIHPGRVARSGASCDKATALTALAAVYRVATALKRGRQ